ncbi:MAG: uroporphyrinogen-III synthase, partial [Tsuneonella sp.]
GAPLFAIEPVPWEMVDVEAIDALLLGSANAVRHAGEQLRAFAGKLVYAVGQKTADAARAAGFIIADTGSGGLQALLGTLQPPLRLLRLAGDAHVTLSPPAGVEIVTRVVYRAAPRSLPPVFAERLLSGGVVLLHSAEAARAFAVQCDALALDREALAIAAIGPRVLAAAGEGWSAARAAERPDDAALLAIAAEMCQKPDQ